MNVVIRADASGRVGYGHVMRCFALAEGLRKQGCTVDFICREDEGNLIEFIRKKHFTVYGLHSDIDSMEDAQLTSRFLASLPARPEYLIVDHYGLDVSWEKHLRASAIQMMVIDDFSDRPHACDVLLNQNYGTVEKDYEGLLPLGCRMLLGPSYVLLRDQFMRARTNTSPRCAEVKNVFIFYGGTDLTNETTKAVEAVRLLDDADLTCSVLVGKSNPHWREIEALCSLLPGASFIRQAYDVASLMVNADLAIGAGGSNIWERCGLGIPSIVTILSENQKYSVEKLDRDGIIVNAGWYWDVTSFKIAAIMKELFSEPTRLARMKDESTRIVDGAGVQRVIEQMFL